jgi:hypothetical protein
MLLIYRVGQRQQFRRPLVLVRINLHLVVTVILMPILKPEISILVEEKEKRHKILAFGNSTSPVLT